MPHPKKPSLQPYHGVQRKSPYAEIPYRSLIPKGSKNFIAVGRCIGVEREALGAVRVMAPCIAMGESAGIATAMAVKDNLNIGDVDIKKLQQKIIKHGGLIKRSHVV